MPNDNHANGHAVTARLSPRVEVIKMEIGSEVPPFCLPDRAGKQQCLSDFRGKWDVLYFYPKDNTVGCTREAMDFSEQQPDFERHNAAIIGISPDSPASHEKFAEKHHLRVLLLSDEQDEVAEKYDVSKTKTPIRERVSRH